MAVVTTETTHLQAAQGAHTTESLDIVHMLQHVATAPTLDDLLRGLDARLATTSQPVALVYFHRDEAGELVDPLPIRPEANDDRTARLTKRLLASAQAACRSGRVEVHQQLSPPRTILASPVDRRGQAPDAVGVMFASDEPSERLMLLTQLMVANIALWHMAVESSRHEREADDFAAVLDLLLQATDNRRLCEVCHNWVAELSTFLQCKRVVIGRHCRRRDRCEVLAMSGMARIDVRSPVVRVMEASLDEAVMRGTLTVWPPTDREQRHAALAHKQLCSYADARVVVSTPLRNADGIPVGAMLVIDPEPASRTRVEQFLPVAEVPLANSLSTSLRLQGGRLSRAARGVGQAARSWTGRLALVAVLAAVGGLLTPYPYRVACDCQVEPVTRRFVAAPYDGTLEKSLVKPGEFVQHGDTLARLDGREIRWQRAAVEADRNQAAKRRDAAQAAGNYGDQRIAQLKMERLDLELQLLAHRSQNLDIKSPVSGIVVSGDVERAEGAPLTVGQTLFEIAPLDAMVVEVAIPDDEVAYVAPGQTIEILLHAFPRETWTGTVTKIHPRSEIRDDANVFVAEAELDNSAHRFRPGMKGRAKVVTPSRAVGWILFHEPWEYLTKLARW